MSGGGINFSRTVGPHADVRELEYISALHQTCVPDLRQDGTIEAVDIVHYLSSRHAIRIAEETVKDHIIRELGGAYETDCMDICQLVTLLIIPYLRRLQDDFQDEDETNPYLLDDDVDNKQPKKGGRRRGRKNTPSSTVGDLGKWFTIFYRDAKNVAEAVRGSNPGSLPLQQNTEGTSHKKHVAFASAAGSGFNEHKGGFTLTTKLLQQILESYGEFGVPPQLLKEMITAAGGDSKGVFMTNKTFLKALTSDVGMYLPHFDKKMRTIYKDAMFGNKDLNKKKYATKRKIAYDDDEEDEDQGDTNYEDENSADLKEACTKLEWRRFYSAPSIDHATDTYRSFVWVTCIWLVFVLTYFAYFVGTSSDLQIQCVEDDQYCRIGKGVITWVDVFLELTMIGVPFIYFSSLGNIVNPTNTICKKIGLTIALLIGIFVMGASVIIPFIHQFKSSIMDTHKIEFLNGAYYVILVCGAIVTLLQIVRLFTIWCGSNKFLNLLSGGTIAIETYGKQAATTKVNLMIEHALMMHYPALRIKDKDSKKSASSALIIQSNSSEVGSAGTKKSSSAIVRTGKNSPKNNSDADKPLSSAKSFQQYLQTSGLSERTGGILWAWRRVVSASLFNKEGIFLHTRTLTCNANQLFISVLFLVALVYVFRLFDEMIMMIMNSFMDPQLEQLAHQYANAAEDGTDVFNAINQTIQEVAGPVRAVYNFFSNDILFSDSNATNGTSIFDALFANNGTNFTNIFDSILESILQDDAYNWEYFNGTALNETLDVLNLTSSGWNASDLSLLNGTTTAAIKASPFVAVAAANLTAAMWNETTYYPKTKIRDSAFAVIEDDHTHFNASSLLDPNFILEEISDIFYQEMVKWGSEIYFFDLNQFKLISVLTTILQLGPLVLLFDYTQVDNAMGIFLNISDNSFFVNSTFATIYFNQSADYTPNFQTDGIFYKNVHANANATSGFYFDDDARFSDAPFLFGFVQKWEINVAILAGFFVALIATFGNTLIFIPSTVSTILKFRCGAIGSLRDPDFKQYRSSPDAVAVLIGTTFWGTLVTGFFAWVLVTIITFLLVWKFLRVYVLHILATMVGIVITIVMKSIALILVRSAFFAGLYRKRPAATNFVTIALECWNLALTAGIVTARTVIFLVITTTYVGRVDAPMLAPGVGCIAGVPLDSSPIAFKKDLLIQEAHRHPYIERLGLMYLMKLRYGPKFGSRAGACWRMVLVLALMPWIRPYRVFKEDSEEDDEDIVFKDEEEQRIARPGLTRGGSRRSRRGFGGNSTRGGFDVGGTTNTASMQLELDILRKENKNLKEELEHMREEMMEARSMANYSYRGIAEF